MKILLLLVVLVLPTASAQDNEFNDLSSLINTAVQGERRGNLGINCKALADGSKIKPSLYNDQLKLMKQAEEKYVLSQVDEWYIPLSKLQLTNKQSKDLEQECLYQFDLQKEGSSQSDLAMVL